MKRIIIFLALLVSMAAQAQFINWTPYHGNMTGVTVPGDLLVGSTHSNRLIYLSDFTQYRDSNIFYLSVWKARNDSATLRTLINQALNSFSSYYTKTQIDAGFQPIGSYLTSSALTPYITSATAAATYQPIGSYALASHLHTGVYQPAGTYLVPSDTVNKFIRIGAGANVSITGTYPNLTISSTGGTGGSTPLYGSTGSATDGAMTQAATTTALSGKEGSITAPFLTGRYWNGFKQFVTLNSDSLTQGSTNLFLTSAERTKLTNTSGTNTGDETTTRINSLYGFTITNPALKVNVSDTASMLSVYLRKVDTAAMLSPYAKATNVSGSLALKVNLSDTASMLSPYAKTANVNAQLSAKQNVLTAQALTDAATTTWNTASGSVATWTIGGNRTLSISGATANNYYQLTITQDATGSRTVTWPAGIKWKGGTAPALTTTAGAKDIIVLWYDGTNYYGNYGTDYK